jgi:toxin HigB-1
VGAFQRTILVQHHLAAVDLHCFAGADGAAWLNPKAGSLDFALLTYLDRIPVSGKIVQMIGSFGDKHTEALFRDERVRQFEGIARAAKRKLEAINAASRLDDLMVPPSNRLEKLKGNLKEFHSIRINDQWRVIFKWLDGEPYEVRIVDYH